MENFIDQSPFSESLCEDLGFLSKLLYSIMDEVQNSISNFIIWDN